MKRFSILLVVALAVAVLSGCATINSHELSGSNLQGGVVQRAETRPSQEVQVVSEVDGSKKVLLPTDPYHTLGILKTEAMTKGRVTIVEGVIPDIRFGEYFPGAIGGKCLAVLGEKEFFCQSILYRLGEDGQFRAAFIVEGLPDEISSARVIALSLKGDYAYDLSGKEFLLDAKFSKEGNERRKFILEKGTLAEKNPLVDPVILRDILSWNEYSTPEGILLSPSGKEEMNYIASINPQYKFIDKLIGTGNFSLKPDPIGVGVGLALDVFKAMNAPATGWDFNSQLPSRRQMGVIFQYAGSLRRAMSKNMFVENVPKKTADPVTVASKPKSKKSTLTVAAPAKKKVVAERKISASTKILVDLGYPENVALALDKKMAQGRKFRIVGIANGTRVPAAFINGKVQGRTKLHWDENPEYVFRAEMYEAEGFTLYRIMNNGQPILFRL